MRTFHGIAEAVGARLGRWDWHTMTQDDLELLEVSAGTTAYQAVTRVTVTREDGSEPVAIGNAVSVLVP